MTWIPLAWEDAEQLLNDRGNAPSTLQALITLQIPCNIIMLAVAGRRWCCMALNSGASGGDHGLVVMVVGGDGGARVVSLVRAVHLR